MVEPGATRKMKPYNAALGLPGRSAVSIIVTCWFALFLAAVHGQNEPSPFPASAFPSWSPAPSSFPSVSANDNDSTGIPSVMQSDRPSDVPSAVPTPKPSLDEPSFATSRFRQQFSVGNGRIFTEMETVLFQGLYGSYTVAFAPSGLTVEGNIITECEFLSQKFSNSSTSVTTRGGSNVRFRRLQDADFLQVDFNMVYNSMYTNVSAFPLLFQSYVNSRLEQVAQQMTLLGLNVTEAFVASRIIIRPDPTLQPTSAPSSFPSVSRAPSSIPSDAPSLQPSSPTSQPTTVPLPVPTSPPTGKQPGSGGQKQRDRVIAGVCAVIATIIVLTGFFVYYRKRKHDREIAFMSNSTPNRNSIRDDLTRNYPNHKPGYQQTGKTAETQYTIPNITRNTEGKSEERAEDIVSPSESLVSNQSLLSTGNSNAGDSRDEIDATHDLADEFDQYKDQKLEIMRVEVEGRLTGADGMMSQALTRALIDEDESNTDMNELLWGASGKLVGTEIEASALCEVTDWMKRNTTPTDDERRHFMQDTLNKMVASVRHGVLGPEEASRSIHECAALLGLQLATEIPVTTIIVSGMRKTVTAADMIDVFSEFGEIADAAVASNQRGFGILRFKTNHSVDLAIKRFQEEEIVVQDVAVQMRVLRPGSTNAFADDHVELITTGSASIVP